MSKHYQCLASYRRKTPNKPKCRLQRSLHLRTTCVQQNVRPKQMPINVVWLITTKNNANKRVPCRVAPLPHQSKQEQQVDGYMVLVKADLTNNMLLLCVSAERCLNNKSSLITITVSSRKFIVHSVWCQLYSKWATFKHVRYKEWLMSLNKQFFGSKQSFMKTSLVITCSHSYEKNALAMI